MTLLECLRSEWKLNRNDIISMLNSRHCPSLWNANQINNFTQMLRNFGSRSENLADDILINDHIELCTDCSSSHFQDDMRSCYQGDYLICNDCCEDNYRYSENQDTYISYDDYDEEMYHENQEENGMYDYCHRVEDDLGKLCLPNEKSMSENNLIYYGVELEVEKRNNCPYDIPYYITDEVLNGFAQCKSDGSLDHGFEITTAPATFGYHKKAWEKFFKDQKCMTNLKG